MARTDPLEVRIEATLARFDKQMNAAVKKLNTSTARMEQRAKRTDKQLSNFGSRFGTGFRRAIGETEASFSRLTKAIITGGALVALSRRARQATDQIAGIGDAADRVGVSTEVFQTLRLAMIDAGQPAQGLEASLRRLQVSIEEGRQGVKEYSDAFRALGITQADLERLSFDEILQRVATGLQGTTDAALRLNIQQALLGRTGTALGATFLAMNKSIADLVRENQQLADIYKDDVIRESQQVNAELTKQWELIDKDLNTALADLTPMLQDFAAGFAAVATKVADAYRAMESYVEVMRTAAGLGLSPEFRNRLGRDGAFDGLIPPGVNPTAPAPTGPGVALQLLKRDGTGIRPLPREGVTNLPATRGTGLTAGILPQDFGGGTTPVPGVGTRPSRSPSGAGIYSAFKAATEASQSYVQSLQEQAAMVGLNAREQAELRVRNDLLTAAQRDGMAVTEELTAEIEARAKATGDVIELLEKKREMEERTAEAVRRAEQRQEAYNAEIARTIDGFSSAVQSADSFSKALQNVAIEAAKVAAQGIFGQGPLAGLLGGLLGGTTSAGGGVTPRAMGGPVMAGRPYLVGEQGPEIVVPRAPGHVLTNRQSRGAMGGVTVVTHIDARGAMEGVAAQIERAVAQQNRNLPRILRQQHAAGR